MTCGAFKQSDRSLDDNKPRLQPLDETNLPRRSAADTTPRKRKTPPFGGVQVWEE